WGPWAIGDHGAPVSLPKLKKAYEKVVIVHYTIQLSLLKSIVSCPSLSSKHTDKGCVSGAD
ncbi:unnamed protein product, partial [Staurois parvus]